MAQRQKTPPSTPTVGQPRQDPLLAGTAKRTIGASTLFFFFSFVVSRGCSGCPGRVTPGCGGHVITGGGDHMTTATMCPLWETCQQGMRWPRSSRERRRDRARQGSGECVVASPYRG